MLIFLSSAIRMQFAEFVMKRGSVGYGVRVNARVIKNFEGN